MRSFNFKTVLNDVSQLKHIQLTKHMHYCIQRIYHMYYTTQWIFIICSKFSHMTLTSANKKEFIRLVATIRRFWLSFYEAENFPLMRWVILNLRKLLQISMHWQKRLLSIISYLGVAYFPFVFLDSVKQC